MTPVEVFSATWPCPPPWATGGGEAGAADARGTAATNAAAAASAAKTRPSNLFVERKATTVESCPFTLAGPAYLTALDQRLNALRAAPTMAEWEGSLGLILPAPVARPEETEWLSSRRLPPLELRDLVSCSLPWRCSRGAGRTTGRWRCSRAPSQPKEQAAR